MVIDETDKQLAHEKKVMCFVYHMKHRMMLVVVTRNNDIASMSGTLLVICFNQDPIDLKCKYMVSVDCYILMGMSHIHQKKKLNMFPN